MKKRELEQLWTSSNLIAEVESLRDNEEIDDDYLDDDYDEDW